MASHNAGVIVVILGLTQQTDGNKYIYTVNETGDLVRKSVDNINPYLVPGRNIEIRPARKSISGTHYMDLGNMPKDGGYLLLSPDEAHTIQNEYPSSKIFIFDFVGSQEFVRGSPRYCIWIEDDQLEEARSIDEISIRLDGVRQMRLDSVAESTRSYADKAHRFKQIQGRGKNTTIVIPKVSSENRPYLPVGLLSQHSIVSDNAFALYDAPLWNMALIASRIHLVWIATVCGKMKTDFRYSNTLGWNTFPVPHLTEQNKVDLTQCAENILLAREAHFPATIADLYKPEEMPPDLRAAHDHNDEIFERIYIGRRFNNDTERLEKLFTLYTEMTEASA